MFTRTVKDAKGFTAPSSGQQMIYCKHHLDLQFRSTKLLQSWSLTGFLTYTKQDKHKHAKQKLNSKKFPVHVVILNSRRLHPQM